MAGQCDTCQRELQPPPEIIDCHTDWRDEQSRYSSNFSSRYSFALAVALLEVIQVRVAVKKSVMRCSYSS